MKINFSFDVDANEMVQVLETLRSINSENNKLAFKREEDRKKDDTMIKVVDMMTKAYNK